MPHTQAVAHDVVGRRTPTADSSRPVSALKVEDLPDPVAPAIPTTVWVGGEPQPAAGAFDDGGDVVDQRVVEPAAGGL